MADIVPFDESLMPAEEPAELAAIQLDDRHMAYAKLRWPDASEKMQQYRIRQAIWARFQIDKPHPDDPTRRLLGGPQPGSGRKLSKTLGAALVEAVQARQREVVDAAFSAIAPGVPVMDRHKAAMNLAKLERDQRALDIAEDEYARKTADEVQNEVVAMFLEMIRSGELSPDDLVDGEADEILDDAKQLSA